MDPTKKRKLDENGVLDSQDPSYKLTPSDARKIIEPFSQDQLLDILQNAAASHPDVLDAVRSVADRDVTQRKLFVRGLGWETTSESLRSVFTMFGDLEEAVVILDKNTGKSKGYGFVTYKHIDSAVIALKDPSKKIDGRVAVAQLASAGLSGGPQNNPSGPNAADVSLRKIYVGNVPHDMPAERLLSLFSSYGEIEEGPLGFDKLTGKSKGFALFVYKTPESAQASLMEPVKNVDGRQLVCKLASEGKKGKPGPGQGPGADSMGMGMQPGGQMPGPYGGPGGFSTYGGYSGAPGGMGQQHPSNAMNSSYPSSAGGGGQGPGGYGGNAGYGGGGGGGYGGSGYGAPNSSGYGGYGGAGSGYGGPVGGGGGGGMGRGSGVYGMPPSSVGVPSGGAGYPDGGPYSGYSSQQHQPTGTSPAPRLPPGPAGGFPPYY